MKKRMLYKLSWGILLAGLTACSDLTDSYKEYLDWGERVYAGKMDSVGVRPGRLRQQLDFFSSYLSIFITAFIYCSVSSASSSATYPCGSP